MVPASGQGLKGCLQEPRYYYKSTHRVTVAHPAVHLVVPLHPCRPFRDGSSLKTKLKWKETHQEMTQLVTELMV